MLVSPAGVDGRPWVMELPKSPPSASRSPSRYGFELVHHRTDAAGSASIGQAGQHGPKASSRGIEGLREKDPSTAARWKSRLGALARTVSAGPGPIAVLDGPECVFEIVNAVRHGRRFSKSLANEFAYLVLPAPNEGR
jgi:hypothetical protein